MADSMTLIQVNAALKDGESLGVLLHKTFTHAQTQQEAVLRDIFAYASECTCGKLWGFKDVDGYEAFRASVPVTDFADYRDYIEAMKMR